MLEIELRERRLKEAKSAEEEARQQATNTRDEADRREREMAEKQATLHFEQESMKEKLRELEKKDAAAQESERLQMEALIKREKELESLRMNQWREKQAM